MIAPKRQQNAYDHRLRESVFRSGRKETAKRIGVPGSTIHGWTKARPRPVVTLIAEGDYIETLEKKVYLVERLTRWMSDSPSRARKSSQNRRTIS
jgi:putative transposase